MDLVSDLHLDRLPPVFVQDRGLLTEWLNQNVFFRPADAAGSAAESDSQRQYKPADTLVVAGDIASVHTKAGQTCWRVFVDAAKAFGYDYLLVVFGNHEHYGGELTESTVEFKTLFGDASSATPATGTSPAIIMLEDLLMENQTTWTHPTLGVRVAGCTLWTNIPNGRVRERIALEISDFCGAIQFHGRNLTIDDTNEFFAKQVHALEAVLASKEYPDVIVTHHAPLLRNGCSDPVHYKTAAGVDRAHAFESDLEELVVCVNVWCFGHTHHITRIQWNSETLVMSNARGYHDVDSEHCHYKGVAPIPLFLEKVLEKEK